VVRTTTLDPDDDHPYPYDLRPKMLISQGCSGSSFAIDMIHEMMEAHHTPQYYKAYNSELFKCEKNPECFSPDKKGEELAMRAAAARVVEVGAVLVVKEQGSSSPEARKAMHDLGAYAVVAPRSNVLAKMICEAKDCFTLVGGSKTKGLSQRVGPHANACFPKRRELPSSQQTRVWLDPEDGKLVKAMGLYEEEKRALEKTLISAGYSKSDFATVTLEALFESESDASAPALHRTVAAWSTTLKSLGITPDAATIQSVLQKSRGKRPASSIYDSIDNADEISKVLAKSSYARGSHATLQANDARFGSGELANATMTPLFDEFRPGDPYASDEAYVWLEGLDDSE
jgi:hypothetical protein